MAMAPAPPKHLSRLPLSHRRVALGRFFANLPVLSSPIILRSPTSRYSVPRATSQSASKSKTPPIRVRATKTASLTASIRSEACAETTALPVETCATYQRCARPLLNLPTSPERAGGHATHLSITSSSTTAYRADLATTATWTHPKPALPAAPTHSPLPQAPLTHPHASPAQLTSPGPHQARQTARPIQQAALNWPLRAARISTRPLSAASSNSSTATATAPRRTDPSTSR